MSLADRRCVACRAGTPPLTPEEWEPLLRELDAAWVVEGQAPVEVNKLVRAFEFRNFVQAVLFVNGVTTIAEAEGHHPDLYVTWGGVTVYLWTHKIRGLAEADFVMAAKIDRWYGEWQLHPGASRHV